MSDEVTASEEVPDVAPAADESPMAEQSTPQPASTGDLPPSPASSSDPVGAWPFVVYTAAWGLFAVLTVWALLDVPRGQAVYESSVYPLSVFGGLALATTGPFVILASWLTSPCPPGVKRSTLFSSALLKGSVSMLLGVSLWWAALIVVDGLRLGRVF